MQNVTEIFTKAFSSGEIKRRWFIGTKNHIWNIGILLLNWIVHFSTGVLRWFITKRKDKKERNKPFSKTITSNIRKYQMLIRRQSFIWSRIRNSENCKGIPNNIHQVLYEDFETLFVRGIMEIISLCLGNGLD